MNFGRQNRIRKAAMCAIAGVLALNLAACGNKDKAIDSSKPVPVPIPAPSPAATKPEPPTDAAAPAAALTGKDAENAALAAKVKAALAADKSIDAIAIDVSAKDGTVSLFGTADSDASRDKAAQIASKVAGVKSVVNKLVIARGS